MMNFDDLYFCDRDIKEDDILNLSIEETRHLTKVKRAAKSDPVFLTNGRGVLARGQIHTIDNKAVSIKIDMVSYLEKPRNIEIFLAPAILKRSAFELLLEKATELYVDRIIPLNTQRSIPDRDKSERWNKIILSAVKQSKQVWKPRLDEMIDITRLIQQYPDVHWYCFHEKAQNFLEIENQLKQHPKIGIIIGPEGGLTDDESALFGSTFLLSKSRLRAETAAITAINQIDLLYRWI